VADVLAAIAPGVQRLLARPESAPDDEGARRGACDNADPRRDCRICYDSRMPDPLSPGVPGALREAARSTPGLDLLMLFGSRARTEAHARSDWDFGYLGDERTDAAALLAALER
jgi:hypothetical protein